MKQLESRQSIAAEFALFGRIGGGDSRLAAPEALIFIWADERKVVITQRAHFAYRVEAGEERKAVVRESEELEGSA